ncbi:DUF192 domain-containing protein [Virgibacillus sp. C22-A2]|uniref:DUF192 domain-containing protein n=1 Tax=Virgibacillus tibetensis TaxID=3042313 RepID=A0ABU6KGH3_9BACI|nr:DUF192 domain-containing protein [Virgibacillus sp. C22-A2]
MDGKTIHLPLQIKHANTYWKRLKGLLFYKYPIIEEGLLITPCNSVHMFFMRFPIDVVFLDKENHVVKTVPNLTPWRMVTPVKTAYSALELPVGTIPSNCIYEGDKVQF